MMRSTGAPRLAIAALAATLLGGCTPHPVTSKEGPDRASAVEAAILRTLADAEQRINQDDLTFVDVFAKDAVIVAPSSANISGLDAIRGR